MIKCIIIDDELNAIKSLLYELEFIKQIKTLATFTSISEAKIFLDNHDVDLVFLDIEMPDLIGVKFLDLFNTRCFEVIFVTAHREHAFDAYKKEIIDYIMKPASKEDLQISINKYLSKVETDAIINLHKKNTLNQSIWITEKGLKKQLKIDDIVYFEADGNYSKIITTENKKMYVSKKIIYFEKILEHKFIRTHNSFLANKELIESINIKNSTLLMKIGAIIPISRQRKKTVIDYLSKQ